MTVQLAGKEGEEGRGAKGGREEGICYLLRVRERGENTSPLIHQRVQGERGGSAVEGGENEGGKVGR